jgi:citrate synthase
MGDFTPNDEIHLGGSQMPNEELVTRYSELATRSSAIDPELYTKMDVKRGLRDLNGKGVLAGLTNIGDVQATQVVDGQTVPAPGKLIYRGINIEDLVSGFLGDGRFGFEEACYLLLFGTLPNPDELAQFQALLGELQRLPDGFTRDMILNAPSRDMMNVLARGVLALYSFDDNADDTSVKNVLMQCLRLIACFPSLAVYGYQAYSHYHGNNSLIIHSPTPGLSIAENILSMLRQDSAYTHLEAVLLDMALVLHAEHGGGNNSTFVSHVVSSTGTDTYSVMAAALGSLKGPKHGGANIKVVQMFEDMKQSLADWEDEGLVTGYLENLLSKQAFDRAGLIYGVGHAVYSISDPRAVIFKEQVRRLAAEKGLEKEFALYETVERLAPEVIGRTRKIYKGVSINIDFYSGFVYSMLNIPQEMFTPIFAISRVAGWSAHHIEEIVGGGKIIRPAYKSIAGLRDYVPLAKR